MSTRAQSAQDTGAGTLVNDYREHGYAVLEAALGADAVQALRDEAVRLFRGLSGTVIGLQPSQRVAAALDGIRPS